jgi:hypothetical protein
LLDRSINTRSGLSRQDPASDSSRDPSETRFADHVMPVNNNADLPPYAVNEVLAKPFPERMRLVCRMWAMQTVATPISVIVLYWAKYLLLFAGGWAFFCSFSTSYPGFFSIGSWAFTAIAFQKAILWAIFYESSGLGCSSGPMNGRFWPPVGGFLHFLRPGTTKLPLFPGLPIFGGIRRTWLDVLLYAANMLLLSRALVAPELSAELLLPSLILIPVLGVTDKTLFLAARAEHYWVVLACLTFGVADGVWISGAKLVWCGIWFWAATSKLNHHFPSVIMVMMNQGPFFPVWLKKRLFVSFPDDLRPSKTADRMAHMGTAVEMSIPFALLASEDPILTALVLFVMFGFHGFIALNNPSGMPVEWNIMMVYGGIFLFGFNPDASVLAIGDVPLLAALLAVLLVAIPLYGNFVPKHVSFLMAMRYYAGNWAYTVWFFRGESQKKLNRLTKASLTMREQLEGLLDDEAVDTAMMMMPSIRLMHLQGKVLHETIPKALDNIEDYEWMEGEVISGLVLGWNFGDGHLNDSQLLEAIQEQCGFEPGELRVIMVESQPLFGRTMSWKIVDAATGIREQGETEIAPLRALQAWPTGSMADAYVGGSHDQGLT